MKLATVLLLIICSAALFPQVPAVNSGTASFPSSGTIPGSVTNDTNIQGTINSSNQLVLSWASTLAATRMVNGGVHAGDCTTTFPVCTISAGAITLAKMANVAANSVLCNNTSGSATPIACSIGQMQTLLSVPTSSGAVTTLLGYTPLNPANNLSDVAVAATARTNLGVAVAPLTGTSASLGGGLLAAGACSTAAVTVTGATTAQSATATPLGGIDPTNGGVLGVSISAQVTSANTVTVRVCSPIAGTPAATTYKVVVQ